MAGHDLALEGAAMAPILYPDPADHAAARSRLRKRYRRLIDSGEPAKMNAGFFLFGLAGALKGDRHA